MTDSAGAIAETMDYFPFGSLRFDKSAPAGAGQTAFSEQRKYIGQEFDPDTGLNYLNARYYNSAIARFTSQDPVSLATPEKLLSDPQQLNLYSYARNNPIVGSDPSGERVWIESKQVFDVKGRDIGVHTYFKAESDHPDEINIQGLPQGAEGFTMGGYNSDNKYFGLTNKLVKNMGTTETSWDKNTAFEGGAKINSMEIKPPEGQNDTQFINNLGKIYNETDTSKMGYFWRGTVQLPGGFTLYNGNCNNFSYTLGVKAGVKDQMDSFNPGPNMLFGAYGYGKTLPAPIAQQIQDKINSIKTSIRDFTSLLINK